MLQLYSRLGRGNGADRLSSAGHTVVNLFNWIRMLDRHNPARIPLDSDPRLHLAGGGQWRWFYRNIELRAVALDVQHKLFVWMFADVFQQGDRIIDGALVKPADNISRVQSGCRCGAFWFYFLDNRCFCRIDEQLPHAFPSPATSLRFKRFNPYRLHLAVSLEFHRNLVALAPHDVPADAVVHSHETPDRFAIHGHDFIARLQAGLFRWRTWHNVANYSR